MVFMVPSWIEDVRKLSPAIMLLSPGSIGKVSMIHESGQVRRVDDLAAAHGSQCPPGE
jgi:hypothetical protein